MPVVACNAFILLNNLKQMKETVLAEQHLLWSGVQNEPPTALNNRNVYLL